MPFYRIGGSMAHLKLSGKGSKNPPAPCCAPMELDGKRVRCCAISTRLCDWPHEAGGTCDAPLCNLHATEVGPDRHLCPRHLAQRDEKAPQLF